MTVYKFVQHAEKKKPLKNVADAKWFNTVIENVRKRIGFCIKKACNRLLNQSTNSQDRVPDEIDSKQISEAVTSRLEQMHVN